MHTSTQEKRTFWASTTAYTLISMSDVARLLLGFPLGFFPSGIFSGLGPVLTELFATGMRGSGQGFAYNFGRGVAALNPWFVGSLSAALPLGQSMGIFALIAYSLVVIAALFLPETEGRELGTVARVTREIALTNSASQTIPLPPPDWIWCYEREKENR